MLTIDVKSPRFECHLELINKITVIRGNSGSGKSVFAKIAYNQSPVHKITLSDSDYMLVVPRPNSWYVDISASIERGIKSVFVIDDEDYVNTKKFADLVSQDKSNFYAIISRFEVFSDNNPNFISYSQTAIRYFKADGKEHYLMSE